MKELAVSIEMISIRKLRRTKTFVLVFLILSIGFYLAINIMTSTLTEESIKTAQGKFEDFYAMKFSEADEIQIQYIAKGQRKPKTTNLDNNNPESGNLEYAASHPIQALAVRRNKIAQYQKDITEIKFKKKEVNANEFRNMDKPVKFNHNDNWIENKIYDYDKNAEYENDHDNDKEQDNNDKDDNNPNPIFKPGDFGDITGLEYYHKPQLQFEEVNSDDGNTMHKMDESAKADIVAATNTNNQMTLQLSKPILIQDGIFWSDHVESLIPKGIAYSNITKLLRDLRKSVVYKLEAPTWNKCGWPKNGFIEMQDGTQMCARYRHPSDIFVFGEALSFYLSMLLGMDNVPAVILSNTSISRQWHMVNISSLEWEDNKTIALIKWVGNINGKAYIPTIILDAYKMGHHVNSARLKASDLGNDLNQLSEVVQWGSMIIFDYLTGNYDRVASMQDAAEKESNPHIMEEPIRNLGKSENHGKLWLIDNESGLFDAYNLLCANLKFSIFHRRMLQTMCIFQTSMVKALRQLYSHYSPHTRLLQFASSLEPLLKYIPNEEEFKIYQKVFKQRLKHVIEWIEYCEKIKNS